MAPSGGWPMTLALLTLLGCRSSTDLSFVVISDDSDLHLPVVVAGFAGFRLDQTVVAPETVAPRWVPVGVRVPGGDTEALAVRFQGEALGLRGRTEAGTPFLMRVATDEIAYGAADLNEPDMVLVLDAGQLIAAEELDAESMARDPDPDDGVAFPIVDGPESERAIAFVEGAPQALWLGTPEQAENRYLIHWPFTRAQLGVEPEPRSKGCGADGPAPPLGPAVTDTAFPDTGAVPADTAWVSVDTGESSSGCGGSGGAPDTSTDTSKDTSTDTSTDSSGPRDTGGSGGGCSCDKGGDSGDTSGSGGSGSSGGCSCSKGGDSDSALAHAPRRWLGLAALLAPLVLRRRRP